MLTIEWLSHMEPLDRKTWTGDQNQRGLNELGLRQAERICEELGNASFDALYSSPARRSIQTIEPMAQRFGLQITKLPGLGDTNSLQLPETWRSPSPELAQAYAGAYYTGRALSELDAIRAEHLSGRIGVCTHGDVMVAVAIYLAGLYGLDIPPPTPTRGARYTLRFEGDKVEVEHHNVPAGFPL
ncbi:MAG: hypothetical protein GEU75_12065 [Dehalococcoidia bacterium]|nr:hypothetical protein [Dehalococcoidia bacterium]